MKRIQPQVSRRSMLRRVAASGPGIVAGGSLLARAEHATAGDHVEVVTDKEAWFAERVWSISGNRLLAPEGGGIPTASRADRIFRPRSAEEVASVVRSLPATTPIACVCGGHESSNAAVLASSDAVILDLALLKQIEFHPGGDAPLVTVGAGVVFRELVEAVAERHASLPVGTGPGVGVVGYLVNGGLSGYFSRRLGLLGQRVVRMTVVTPAGHLRVLTPEDELFVGMLGAGSGLAIVCDVTIRMDEANAIQAAEQRVMAFETRPQAVEFARAALQFMRDQAFPDEAVSMELVVTGTKVVVVTVVFYDSFQGSTAEFVAPLEAVASRMNLPVVATAHWGSWYETAAALWPVIAGQKGFPLATLQHCVGTKDIPEDRILDFVCDTLIAEAPLDQAELSLVEIRTLGGAILSGTRLPSGNCHHAFFVDLITLFDAKGKSATDRHAIVAQTRQVIDKARAVPGLTVDFSGTHSQPDDANRAASPAVIFGTEAMAETVQRLKQMSDPHNRLRFHPFARFL